MWCNVCIIAGDLDFEQAEPERIQELKPEQSHMMSGWSYEVKRNIKPQWKSNGAGIYKTGGSKMITSCHRWRRESEQKPSNLIIFVLIAEMFYMHYACLLL